MALALATTSARRSGRYPRLAVLFTMPRYVLRGAALLNVVWVLDAAGLLGEDGFFVCKTTPFPEGDKCTPTAYKNV